jgi:hypothetical protein
MGKLCWDDINSAEAFSILACYHWGASAGEAAKLGGNDAMSMHLRMAEGNGISKADVKKATKVVLLAPKDIDVLSKQIGVFLVMCQVIFGTNSDIVKELTGWVDHILANETTYQHLQAADSIFTTKRACYLDC